ncbi:MAG: phosphatidylserine decarboxylase [Polyangiaceae bacterium]
MNKLARLIEERGYRPDFDAAIDLARREEVHGLGHIRTLDDYLQHLDNLLRWAPRYQGDARVFEQNLLAVYFYLSQEPVKRLQTPIVPGREGQSRTPLSDWLVDYVRAIGAFHSTPESAARVDSFREDPLFHWHDYMPPPGGYLTFNQFFARHIKPGMRPVARPWDDSILVSPTDSQLVGCWQIAHASTVHVREGITVKGLRWSIDQLLAGSPHASRFAGGIFTHSFLDTFDYHRWHTPVRGKVIEARVIQGQVYMDVTVRPAIVSGERVNVLDVIDGTGYQFAQTRGLVILDSPLGLVACLPIGMAEISSVILTAEEGVTLRKGEELGYFQAGGSDFVMLFERASNVRLLSRPGEHVRQGMWIGSAMGVAL